MPSEEDYKWILTTLKGFDDRFEETTKRIEKLEDKLKEHITYYEAHSIAHTGQNVIIRKLEEKVDKIECDIMVNKEIIEGVIIDLKKQVIKFGEGVE